ncbi:hypothetical protein F8M41_015254 [Gigaspora margarita]|uniref:Uncharacterized protein n=1 Tax=Gigaspora margarita TaxID=4874 RepID=A0A8H3WWD8_GIGMA|nr:hypothetical protein F8M41_015254 [Gigaspora margarita]
MNEPDFFFKSDLFIEFISFNSNQNKSISTSLKLYKSNIEKTDIEDKLVTFNSFLDDEQLYESNIMLDHYILANNESALALLALASSTLALSALFSLASAFSALALSGSQTFLI